MSLELKIELIHALTLFTNILRYGFLVALIGVGWLAWKRGKKLEAMSSKDLLRTFIFGWATCLLFLGALHFPWHSRNFWIIGLAGIPAGLILTRFVTPVGIIDNKLQLKNYRIYALVWLAVVITSEFLIGVFDSLDTTSAGTFLFGGMVMTTVIAKNAWWLRRGEC